MGNDSELAKESNADKFPGPAKQPRSSKKTEPVVHMQQDAGNQAIQELISPTTSGSKRVDTQSRGTCKADLNVAPPVAHEVLRSPGQPLDAKTRGLMEARLGHDFGNVRVHTDAQAARSAGEIDARAYTVKRDIVFASDQFSTTEVEGQRLLAHELAHVVQQERGGSSAQEVGGPVLEQAADAAAAAVLNGDNTVHVSGASAPGIARQPTHGVSGSNLAMPPRSLQESLNSDSLSLAELKQEIELIEQWLAARPAAREVDYLRVERDRLQVALRQRETAEVPLEKPNLPDIAGSSRYIDNVFESVEFHDLNGAFTFIWPEGGKEKSLTIPLREVIQDDSAQFVALWELHKSKEEALKRVQMYSASAPQTQFYSFYERPDGVIMPTSFSIASTPKFHGLWPALKHDMVENRKDIARGLQQIANAINPIPGTTVDEQGNVKISGDPMDWITLLFHFKRLERIKEGGPYKIKYHSGYDVPYRVIGPHDKLAGTSVYVLKDAEGTVLYVGKGETLNRLREHIKDPKKTQWFGEIAEVEVRATSLNNTQALALEENLIGQLDPLHNIDEHPFQTEFGDAMQIGPNLPPTQKMFKFLIEWGH